MQIAALFFVVVFVFHLATEVFTKYKILLDNSTKKKKTREKKLKSSILDVPHQVGLNLNSTIFTH